jgi:hypothetical protein
MTRTLLLTIAAIGVGPAVLLASCNLLCDFVSIVYRPISFSFRLYRPNRPGESLDFLPALHLSTTTSLLIIAGAALLLFGILRIQPETMRIRTPPSSSPLQ